jgi:hypothetical protein
MDKAFTRASLTLLVFWSGFLGLVSRASADSVPGYSAYALANVGYGCGDLTGGLGFSSATAVCNNPEGSATVAVDMGSGMASVSVYSPEYEVRGDASFANTLTITAGGGDLTWGISGITGNGAVDISMDNGPYFSRFASCNANCGGTLTVTVPVATGATVNLSFFMGCDANYSEAGPLIRCAINDGMYLTGSPGISYTSAFPGFLSGTTSIPEPTESTLCGVGLLGLVFARRRLKQRPAK